MLLHDYFYWKVQKPNQTLQGNMLVSMNIFSGEALQVQDGISHYRNSTQKHWMWWRLNGWGAYPQFGEKRLSLCCIDSGSWFEPGSFASWLCWWHSLAVFCQNTLKVVCFIQTLHRKILRIIFFFFLLWKYCFSPSFNSLLVTCSKPAAI